MEEPASQRDTFSPLTDPARWDSDSRAHESSRQLSSTVPERRNAGFMRTAIWELNMVKTAGEGALPLTVDHGEAQSTIYLQLHTQLDLADAVCAIFVSGLPYCEASLGTWLSELLSPFGKVQQTTLHPSQVLTSLCCSSCVMLAFSLDTADARSAAELCYSGVLPAISLEEGTTQLPRGTAPDLVSARP